MIRVPNMLLPFMAISKHAQKIIKGNLRYFYVNYFKLVNRSMLKTTLTFKTEVIHDDEAQTESHSHLICVVLSLCLHNCILNHTLWLRSACFAIAGQFYWPPSADTWHLSDINHVCYLTVLTVVLFKLSSTNSIAFSSFAISLCSFARMVKMSRSKYWILELNTNQTYHENYSLLEYDTV